MAHPMGVPRVYIEDFQQGDVLLPKSTMHYLTGVRRLKKGEHFIVFSGDRRAKAVLVDEDSCPHRCR